MSLANTENDPDYWLSSPEDIRAALFELMHPDSHIVVRDPAERELAVQLLAIDKSTRSFFWLPRDYEGSDFAENDTRGLMAGTVFDVIGHGYSGVQIRFRISRPEVVRLDDGRSALWSGFPERLARIQRRRSFRAQVQVSGSQPGIVARWTPAALAAETYTFNIRDISIEGIGMRCNALLSDLPAPGETMKDVTLDFGDAGTLRTSLQVRNAYALGRQPGQPLPDGSTPHVDPALEGVKPPMAKSQTHGAHPPLTHLGALFVDLDARQETWLQQVVWRLEKQRNSSHE